MKRLSFLVAASLMSLSPAAGLAETRAAGASGTDVCRLVQLLIIDGEIYEHWQCVIYQSGAV